MLNVTDGIVRVLFFCYNNWKIILTVTNFVLVDLKNIFFIYCWYIIKITNKTSIWKFFNNILTLVLNSRSLIG